MASKLHTLEEEQIQTGSSSHYDIPFYTTCLKCSCGWKHSLSGKYNDREKAIRQHKIDIMAEDLGYKFKFNRG